MKHLPFVLVSQRVDYITDRQEVRDSLDHRLVSWLNSVGVYAIPVPNSFDSYDFIRSYLSLIDIQAVVLSGGNDIGEFKIRDFTETCLLKSAALHSLPVLGICRGMQMLAHFSGIGLEPVVGHVRTRHSLNVSNSLYRFPATVNSFHSMRLMAIPPGYESIAESSDGSLEVIRNTTYPWEGWMWHPEREDIFSTLDIERARIVFQLARVF